MKNRNIKTIPISRFHRFRFRPVLGLNKDGSCITACKQHLALAKQIATEGTVLLKNDGTLPLPKGSRICVFGRGAGEFIFGGGGSGNVHTDIQISLTDALLQAEQEGKLHLFHPLIENAESQAKSIQDAFQIDPREPFKQNRDRNTLPVPEDIYRQAVEFGGTAVFTLLRYATESTIDGDRHADGDFYLTEEECAQLQQLTTDFEKVVAVLVTPGPVCMTEFARNDRVGAVLYPLYGGSYAGAALVDILLGDSYPSGHLQDTLAADLSDYPGADSFYDSKEYVNYKEDIFVGYRWFETFCPEKVLYPFGYGLSYTTFRLENLKAEQHKNTVSVELQVRNTGNFPGKEVVQIYLTAPQGKLGKAKRVLTAFQKTKELKPGQTQFLRLHFDLRDFASFDDLGKIAKSCFVLEQGEYTVSVGCNVRDSHPVISFDWQKDVIVRRCHSYMAPDPEKFPSRLCADGSYERLPEEVPVHHPLRRYFPKGSAPEVPLRADYALKHGQVDEFLLSLSDKQLADLLHGHNDITPTYTCSIGAPREPWQVYTSCDTHKLPLIPTCDGPAGLRTVPGSGRASTFFPSSNTLSQAWDPKLAQRMGKAIAMEVKENNCGIWLAPGMNIHRNPLCGRNFEYMSEDPLCTGLIAAGIVRGAQSQRIAATVKHFCCNNKETNRKNSDSRVSQRALREVYLRGFEICIKKADPWCLMLSYNLVNGVRNTGNWELVNGILKGEWKYPGLVMTDWRTASCLVDDIKGGCDVRMPYQFTPSNVVLASGQWHFVPTEQDVDPVQAIQEGLIDRGVAYEVARRFMHLLSHLE